MKATLSLITSDVRELKLTLGRVVQDGLAACATLAGGVGMLYAVSARLTLLLCAAVPVVFSAGTVLAGTLKKVCSCLSAVCV